MQHDHIARQLATLTTACVLAACAGAPATAPATASIATPLTAEVDVYNRYERAMNQGDFAGMMALVADDATFDNPGRCKPNPCRGKAVLNDFIKETVIDVKGRLKTLGVNSKPGELDARVEFTSEKVRASGIDRILGTERWKISGGKITAFAFDIDRADKQSMAYIGSLQHAAAQEAARRAQAQPKP